MLNALRKFLNATSIEVGPLAPETPFVAIGDIHGQVDLLTKLLDQLPDLPIICVGDYVDRGDQSSEVLDLLQSRLDIICLMGNHEEMMLRFIDDPKKDAGFWLSNGGLQTMASFGITGINPSARGETHVSARDALITQLGGEGLNWLQNLPSLWRSGNIAVVHAGADPTKSIEHQNLATLRWGHPEFFKKSRKDGVWILHGHTIVDAPSAKEGRIAIDTGAYATGNLTAAIIEPGKATFKTI